MYNFISPKLSLDLFSRYRQLGATNGFELWRLLNKEKDPIRKEQEFFMDIQLQNMSHAKAKNFAESYSLMIELESKVLEYRTVIGKHPNLETLGKILWARLDAATQDKAEDTAGLDFMDYMKMGVHIRELQEKVLGRQGVRSTPASSNRMVDGLQAPGHDHRFINADNSAGQEDRFLNHDRPADQGSDPWNQGEDPWQMVGRGGQIVPGGGNDLDAFNKGKGKSKGGGKDGI